jgi:hypothetical protein
MPVLSAERVVTGHELDVFLIRWKADVEADADRTVR